MQNKLDFNTRSTKKESLDKLSINASDIKENLNDFIMINKYLGSKRVLIQALNKIYLANKKYSIEKGLTIVDLGCGAGDLLINIHQWANQKKIISNLIGIDNNPVIIDVAKQKTCFYGNILIKHEDLFSYASNLQSVDIICINSVLHHFSEEKILQIIHLLSLKTNLAIIINDLRRNVLAYYGIKWISKVLNMSKLSQHDGPLSVSKGFKQNDFEKYFSNLKIKNYELKKSWAFRWQAIIWLNNS